VILAMAAVVIAAAGAGAAAVSTAAAPRRRISASSCRRRRRRHSRRRQRRRRRRRSTPGREWTASCCTCTGPARRRRRRRFFPTTSPRERAWIRAASQWPTAPEGRGTSLGGWRSDLDSCRRLAAVLAVAAGGLQVAPAPLAGDAAVPAASVESRRPDDSPEAARPGQIRIPLGWRISKLEQRENSHANTLGY
jgi:hypothetical protein